MPSDALRFNKLQGFGRDEIRLVQRVVGATTDGVWGEITVEAVCQWQKANGLTPDGMVGPLAWEAMVEEADAGPTRTCDVQIGCGLAAYDQVFPGKTGADAMKASFDAAMKAGAREIRYWSSEWLIEDIGNKGSKYAEPFLKALDVPDGVRMGAWVDDPVKALRDPAYAQRLAGMGLTSGALMINRANTTPDRSPWSIRFKDDDLKLISDNFEAAGIARICTTWPRPSKSMIDQMCEDMSRIVPLCGAVAFEVDTESNWMPAFLQGFNDMREASDYLALMMRAAVGNTVDLELTTYTYHHENGPRALLAPLMDRLLPQAYGVRHRSEGNIDWDDSLGPVRHPGFAMKRARAAAS